VLKATPKCKKSFDDMSEDELGLLSDMIDAVEEGELGAKDEGLGGSLRPFKRESADYAFQPSKLKESKGQSVVDEMK
jgi:hypothetical protein